MQRIMTRYPGPRPDPSRKEYIDDASRRLAKQKVLPGPFVPVWFVVAGLLAAVISAPAGGLSAALIFVHRDLAKYQGPAPNRPDGRPPTTTAIKERAERLAQSQSDWSTVLTWFFITMAIHLAISSWAISKPHVDFRGMRGRVFGFMCWAWFILLFVTVLLVGQ